MMMIAMRTLVLLVVPLLLAAAAAATRSNRISGGSEYHDSSSTSSCTIFNFGDSNSDTGGGAAGLGYYLGPPSGREFFHMPTGRFCDGRLYIDFLCEDLGMELLSPYLESSGSDFSHGVDFAVAGATIEPKNSTFPLPVQLGQFFHFKNRTKLLRPTAIGRSFEDAVYTIDIGQNDLAEGFSANLSYSSVVAAIPTAISIINATIQSLYASGASKFMVYNTGPLGCLPQKLALDRRSSSELDEHGCLADHNKAAKAFNDQLLQLCRRLRSQLDDATIVYVDMFAIKLQLIANHTQYGIEHPLMTCCGYGGPPYNYVNLMTCGQPTVTACPVGSRYVSWDGVHNTQFANSIVASMILSANYSDPAIQLHHLCNSSSNR